MNGASKYIYRGVSFSLSGTGGEIFRPSYIPNIYYWCGIMDVMGNAQQAGGSALLNFEQETIGGWTIRVEYVAFPTLIQSLLVTESPPTSVWGSTKFS